MGYNAIINISTPQPEHKEKVTVAVEVQEKPKVQSGGVRIIPKGNDGVRPKSKYGYWGIGVYTDGSKEIHYQGQDYLGTVIGSVVDGYIASEIGLLPGDVIFMVNDYMIFGDNDVRSDKPGKIKIKVWRMGIILEFNIERDWIET